MPTILTKRAAEKHTSPKLITTCETSSDIRVVSIRLTRGLASRTEVQSRRALHGYALARRARKAFCTSYTSRVAD